MQLDKFQETYNAEAHTPFSKNIVAIKIKSDFWAIVYRIKA